MLPGYDTVVQELVDEARSDGEVTAMLLTGSLARGDALPGTDIDIRYIVDDGVDRPFQREFRGGILVERGYACLADERSRIDTQPMNVYAHLDGQILHDPHDVLEDLRAQAQRRFDDFTMPADERAEIAFLLGCSRDKIAVALDNDDLLRAAFVTGTSSWGIMQGLWAAAGKPLPPNSSVRPHLSDLAGDLPDIEDRFDRLFLADAPTRSATALDLIDWIIARLR
jgi:hypothetical protein